MTEEPIDPQVLLNEAVEFHQTKRLIEAESNYLLLLEHLPNIPEINNLYALLLTQTDRSEEAIPYLKIVISEDPNEENLMRYAMICLKHDQTEAALDALEKLISTQPDHMEARILQARGLQAKGDHKQALLKFSIILSEKPDSPIALHHMGQCLHQYEVNEYSDEIASAFSTIMHHPDIQPQKLFHNAVSLILKHDAIARYLAKPDREISQLLEETKVILSSKLFTILLDDCLIVNKNIEQLLTRLRDYFLSSLSSNDGLDVISKNAPFICHLANQCFYNEYVYSTKGTNFELLTQIIHLFGDTSAEMVQFNKGLIGLRACFDSLAETELCDLSKDYAKKHDDAQLFALVQSQITEPEIETTLARNMPTLGVISDAVSQKVQTQYEQSPYPRWKYYSPITPRSFLDDLSRQLPNFDVSKLTFTKKPDILIAGCGTGQHPLMIARTIENARVTAIDLSRRSLSYAKRKAEEMKIKTIDFLQADILSLEKLEKQFDVIESIGVIHHMEDPLQALAKLNDMLKPGGYMKIGLYSRAARTAFSLARNEINKMGIADNVEDIRDFRTYAFNLPPTNPLSEITKAYDLYSLSTCRDLIFHVQEHLFTIPEISKALTDLDLKFLGFNFPSSEQYLAFKRAFPINGTEKKLANWAAFEEMAPNCFGAMYVFWIQKPAN